MGPDYPHHGIAQRRTGINFDVMGLIFLIGGIVFFVAGEPAMRALVVGAIVLGLVIAAALHFLHSSTDTNPTDLPSTKHDGYPHPGITMHQIRFGGGFAGLLFTVGCMLVFLFGTPGLWVVFPAAILLGVLIATVLHFLHR